MLVTTARLTDHSWFKWLISDLSNLSKSASAGLSTDGEQCMRCCTLGALNETRSRVSASWAHISWSLSISLDSSEQRLAQAVSNTQPASNVAPSNSASSTLTLFKEQSVGSEITVCWYAIISHLLLFRHKPIVSPSVIIVCMSATTTSTKPPRVTSSK